MRPLSNPDNPRPIRKGRYKSKNERKARWSRLLLHNEKRTYKKSARQYYKKQIIFELNLIELWKKLNT